MQGTYCIYLPISTPSLDCKDSLSGSCSASWSKTTHVQHIEGLDDFQGHCPCFNGYLTHVSGVCPIGNYEHIPSWNIMDLSILWEFKRTMDDLPWLPTKKNGWTWLNNDIQNDPGGISALTDAEILSSTRSFWWCLSVATVLWRACIFE